jgi:hypothetical protein
MNWRRGFFRLWLVASGLWLVLNATLDLFAIPDLLRPENASHLLGLAFGPPAALLVIGAAVGWALQGFRRTRGSA